MAGLCIPRSIANKLRTAIKGGDINLDKLYRMKDAESHALFENYVGKENASLVNAVYEKAKVTAEKRAGADYVPAEQKGMFARKATAGEFGKNLLTSEESKKIALEKVDKNIASLEARRARVIERMKSTTGSTRLNLEAKLSKMDDQATRLQAKREDTVNPVRDVLLKKIEANQGLLSDSLYRDLAKAKTGINVTPGSEKYILQKAAKLRELAPTNKDAAAGYSLGYLKERAGLDRYIRSLEPISPITAIVRDILDTGRNLLLMNPATPIKAAESQLIMSVIDKTATRVATATRGGLNPELRDSFYKDAQQYAKASNQHINLLQMTSPDEAGALGEKSNFDAPRIGVFAKNPIVRLVEKGTNVLNRGTTKISIELEHQILFNKFYQKTALDMMDLYSSKIAKGEGLTGAALKQRAGEIFRDSYNIEPKTDEAKLVREQAQNHAASVTNTNKGVLSDILLAAKNALNNRVPGLGEAFGVIVKIPANIIGKMITYSGPGIAFGLKDLYDSRALLSSADETTQLQGVLKMTNGINKLVITTGTLGAAALLTQNLTKNDFRTDNYGNQFVRFNGVWINREYFNILGGAMGGMLTLRKDYVNGQSLSTSAYQYTSGAAQSLKGLPMVGDINTFITDTTATGGKKIPSYFMGLLSSRGTPAFVSNLMKTRPVDRLFFGATGVETQSQVSADNQARNKASVASRRANRKP